MQRNRKRATNNAKISYFGVQTNSRLEIIKRDTKLRVMSSNTTIPLQFIQSRIVSLIFYSHLNQWRSEYCRFGLFSYVPMILVERNFINLYINIYRTQIRQCFLSLFLSRLISLLFSNNTKDATVAEMLNISAT